jgi:hypothetical protein
MMSLLTGCAPRPLRGLSSSLSCVRSGCDRTSSWNRETPRIPSAFYCELDDGLLLDLSIDDEAFPDAPAARRDGDWVVFVEGHEGGYRAEVTIPGDVPFPRLARRLVDLTDAVALGEHPFLKDW